VLMIGWSLLEGLGAALIMPAIVALVATNFSTPERPRAYGLVAASGAVAVAVGPLIGGVMTTYASWRWVFAGEVVIVAVIVVMTRRLADGERDRDARLDLVGTALSAIGLGLVVFGILRGGVWGFVNPKPGGPEWLGLSPVVWLVLGGAAVITAFLAWERRRLDAGEAVLIDPAMLRIPLLRSGLTAFFFQFLLQAGLFFCVPLYLSVALGLSAVDTGIRIMPLSITLLLAAVGVPKLFPHASPRRVTRIGFLLLLAGIVSLMGALEVGTGPEIVTGPLLLAGLGIGALASQLGAVTVSSVPDEQSAEVGGIQNTFTNLGASIGTAMAGAVLISALTSSFLSGIQSNPEIPDSLSSTAQVELAGGIPFIPDSSLGAALSDAGVDPQVAEAVVEENAASRIAGLRSALGVLAVLALLALAFTGGIPVRQAGADPSTDEAAGAVPEGADPPAPEVIPPGAR
jgi:predicted MFS family arabinose efflux permease